VALGDIDLRFAGHWAEITEENILPLFTDRAPCTLKKHLNLSGWFSWFQVCCVMGWNAAQPTLHELLESLRRLGVGSYEDRGCNRRQSALSVLS
jgi:hypothetical protein